MSKTYTTFHHQLTRTPSPWAEIGSSLLSSTACVIAGGVMLSVLLHARTPPAGYWWAVFGGVVAVALLRITDTFGLVDRIMTGRMPTVEVERQPWRPGEAQRVHVANPDVSDLDSFEVFLEANDVLIAKAGSAVRVSASPFSRRQHESKVFTAEESDLAQGKTGIDLVARVQVPLEAEGKSWQWRVRVQCHPVRGSLRQYSFPLEVDAYPMTQSKAG
jgi:hypothetical protein